MFKTHGRKLLSFVIGMVTCIIVFAVLILTSALQLSSLLGIVSMVFQWLVTITPIVLYSFVVDANEDCFDCFNRLQI
jgi:hypothetical protein